MACKLAFFISLLVLELCDVINARTTTDQNSPGMERMFALNGGMSRVYSGTLTRTVLPAVFMVTLMLHSHISVYKICFEMKLYIMDYT